MYEVCTHVKLFIENTFAGVACATFEQLFFDEAFNEALGRALRMGRKLLHLERTTERIVRHVCYEPDRDPDSPANQAFGTSRASFVEELDYDVRARCGAWKTIPNLFADRVRNSGTIEFAEVGDGTKRTVRGEVVVTLFGFGRIVERMIVAEIEKNYANTTRFTTEYLKRI